MLRSACLLCALTALIVAPQAAAAPTWQWPVRGPLVGPFLAGAQPFARGQHRGIDIAAPGGAPVLSACPGRVRFAGTAGTSGRTVSVRCGRLIASYLHLRSIAVREGVVVEAGRRLGAVGRSGRPRISDPHLHFGVRVLGERWSYVDPLSLLADPAPSPGPLMPAGRRAPGPLGPAPRRRLPRALPRATTPFPLAPPAPAATRRGPALPWTAWAGLGLLALGAPAGALRARRRRGSGDQRREAAHGALPVGR